MRLFILFISMILSPALLSAQTKEEADSAYSRGDYDKAAAIYEKLLENGQSADILYNLGNAYYRSDNITRAIINYERALLLSPGDADIRFNLQMAQSRTVDKIVPESEMFLLTWWRWIVSLMSSNAWAVLALAAMAAMIALMLTYLFTTPVWLRKTGFFGATAMLAVFILANFCAYAQQREQTMRSGAVVTAGAAEVKSTPAIDGTDLFVLHEGTKVKVVDSSMNDWREIEMPDGKKGWIEKRQIEMI